MGLSLGQKNKPVKRQWLNISLRSVILSLCLLTLAGIFYAYSSVRALNLSYQTSQALEVQHELLETSRRLKVEISNLRSLERLERQATTMGLQTPGAAQIRKLQ